MIELPELPKPWHTFTKWTPPAVRTAIYSDEQMRAYGEQCAKAERERCVLACEAVAFDGCHEWRREAVDKCVSAIRSQGE
jgi:hypothetical protein